jgi:hypothetical protein
MIDKNIGVVRKIKRIMKGGGKGQRNRGWNMVR